MAWLNLKNVYGLEKFDKYEMNQEGILRSVKTKYVLKGYIYDGYVWFKLKGSGPHRFISIIVYKHRLIAELFVWNPDNLPCVDHIDRNRLNNAVENLRWCSNEEPAWVVVEPVNQIFLMIESHYFFQDWRIAACVWHYVQHWRPSWDL
jgi:hypothetical protein